MGEPDLRVGPNRVAFAVLDKANKLVAAHNFQLYFGKGEQDKAQGPVPVTFADDGLGEHAFYEAPVTFPSKGTWALLVAESTPQGMVGGGTEVQVGAPSNVPNVGEAAISTPTPTFADHKGVAAVCTREPNDPMHDISLDAALKNGKPTVLVFASPKFCTSRLCGPVVDQVLRVHDELSAKANFIHVEVYQDENGKVLAPAMLAWKLEAEPATFVIDKNGIVRTRFIGPVTAGEVRQGLLGVLNPEAKAAAAGAPGLSGLRLAAVGKAPAGKPPGERNPMLGLAAGASIVIALAAGIYVYKVIRKGL